ncbi:dual specificity protein phosphatase PHS1-like isoform X2 [Dioscorea cayenensis subsp. rotundata]|uniref:Dual specificity protein phosphatase PHS1-like isoform X2 n=1 Tax=Dioscorea cayennensis subsp. rotundata TaxID=55577 RepID=A0AB40AHK0_DIOCR|nr:dual specificity protein phosphatase PHS1-like isoform X2 [Dioscorea cayenensis subsp. rotundata]
MAHHHQKDFSSSSSTTTTTTFFFSSSSSINAQEAWRLLGEVVPGPGHSLEEWVAFVRKRSGRLPASGSPHRPRNHPDTMATSPCSPGPELLESSGELVKPVPCDQAPEISLRERLGNASMLDIESESFSWDALSSLHHTKYTTNADHSEDEFNKALEVTVNSGGVVFYALFNTMSTDDLSPNEAAAVIKFSTSRMATQSERLGYEFAKWLGVRTPQARVVHYSSTEWQCIKDATEKARGIAITVGDEVGELTCSELLEALELSRCLFLMNYIHGSHLLENSDAFSSQEAAENTAAALGRVFVLDLILRNEDRLPCRQLGWRGNSENLLFASNVISADMDIFDNAYDSATKIYKPRLIQYIQKERRSNSISGRLSHHKPDHMSLSFDAVAEIGHHRSTPSEVSSNASVTVIGDSHIVAIDSVVPRRPPAGKRVKDQEYYPKVVELMLNNTEFSSNLLYEVSGGKLGFPSTDDLVITDSCSSLSDIDMAAVVREYRVGFRAALRDLQGFHIFLLTVYQKLDGLFRVLLPIISKSSGESEKDEPGACDSPSHSAGCGFNYFSPAFKERATQEINAEFSDFEAQKSAYRSPPPGRRDSLDMNSPLSRENWNGRYSKGNGDTQRSLRLTMRLRDFNKFSKVDVELNKELEQWSELLRTDVIKLCQENNFNTGFFEGNDNNIIIDAYELKVRLEHILERIGLISDAANTEKPSLITSNLFIGGALAARSMYTLQHLGITHILCLCSNEIGQSDSQYPDMFNYRNFSIIDNEDEDIADLFEEASDFIDCVEYMGGKVLVHCFEGRSRSATVVLAYLMLRKGLTLLQAWNKLKKVHRRAQPNDGFAKTLLDLDKRLHGKASMEWQQRRPTMKKSHRKISSGSVDSAMTLEIQKTLEALKISRGGSISPTQKQPQSFIEAFAPHW